MKNWFWSLVMAFAIFTVVLGVVEFAHLIALVIAWGVVNHPAIWYSLVAFVIGALTVALRYNLLDDGEETL
jgi:hypothetical protein